MISPNCDCDCDCDCALPGTLCRPSLHSSTWAIKLFRALHCVLAAIEAAIYGNFAPLFGQLQLQSPKPRCMQHKFTLQQSAEKMANGLSRANSNGFFVVGNNMYLPGRDGRGVSYVLRLHCGHFGQQRQQPQ